MDENKLKNMAKCYADAPDGTKNKYLTFKTYDFSHTIDLFNRLVNQGWKIRAAFHQNEEGKSMKIPLNLIDGDISTTYKAKKELDKKLDKYYNNLSKDI